MTLLFTIGFTQKSAQRFFTLLQEAGVTHLIDTRLRPGSQLSGFAKGRDLEYFLRTIVGIRYSHHVELAPTETLLKPYQAGVTAWPDYARAFSTLLGERAVEQRFTAQQLDRACLLRSEASPQQCHRRLVADHFALHIPGLAVTHLE